MHSRSQAHARTHTHTRTHAHTHTHTHTCYLTIKVLVYLLVATLSNTIRITLVFATTYDFLLTTISCSIPSTSPYDKYGFCCFTYTLVSILLPASNHNHCLHTPPHPIPSHAQYAELSRKRRFTNGPRNLTPSLSGLYQETPVQNICRQSLCAPTAQKNRPTHAIKHAKR